VKRKIGFVLATCAVAAGTQIAVTATPSSAAVQYMIRNHATGKCLQGTDNGTLNVYPVKMVSCTRSNTKIWWGASSGKIVMVRAGTNSQICLSIPKSPSGDFAHDVDSAPCGKAGYNQILTYGVTSNYPIGSSEPCYVGHYSASDTYASCYVSDGSYTRWDWVA
jgi:hypothetical protein